MKKLVLILIIIIGYGVVYGQNDPKCTPRFWTLKTDGLIQQWTIENDVIVRGDSLWSPTSLGGLAYCNFEDTPTLYVTNHPDTGFIYYDDTDSWVTVPTAFPVVNNGGHNNDQYFMSPRVNGNKVLYHYDGENLTTIDSLSASEVFSIADIAVDTSGHAWVFKGTAQNISTKLNVYNRDGLIKSYDMSLTAHGLYGTFFLYGTLYIGSSQFSPLNRNSITPVIIENETVTFGDPISFPYDDYTDMASCEFTGSVSISELLDDDTRLFPNPTDGLLYLSTDQKINSAKVYNLAGAVVLEIVQNQDVDLSHLSNGCYFVKAETENGIIIRKIIKI